MSRLSSTLMLLPAALLIACGGGDAPAPAGQPSGGGGSSATAAPAPTGKIITVDMQTDEHGSYYAPKEVEAEPGDVVRFVLATGVHNVHFVSDSNPGVAGLPEAGEMLQLPGQTWDFTVPSASGKRLYYHCDPHAALGMVGYVIVK